MFTLTSVQLGFTILTQGAISPKTTLLTTQENTRRGERLRSPAVSAALRSAVRAGGVGVLAGAPPRFGVLRTKRRPKPLVSRLAPSRLWPIPPGTLGPSGLGLPVPGDLPHKGPEGPVLF